MNDKIKKFLVDIGLSDKEAAVYIALLSVDDASIIDLAHTTAINRTTLYPIISELIEKKLVTETKHDKKVRFVAESPERIATFVQNQKAKLEEQEKVLDDMVPQMRGLVRQTGERPIIKYYEGREGILKSIGDYFQAEDKNSSGCLIYPRDIIKNVFTTKEQDQAKQNRLKHNVKLTSIYTSSDEVYQSDNTSTRFRIDPEQYPVSCEIGIYSDRVHIHTLVRDMSAIYIKSKDVAETMKTLFRLAIKGIEAEEKGNK